MVINSFKKNYVVSKIGFFTVKNPLNKTQIKFVLYIYFAAAIIIMT